MKKLISLLLVLAFTFGVVSFYAPENGIASAVGKIAVALSVSGTDVSSSDVPWDGRSSEQFESGSGTSEDPYIIANGAQLYHLSLQAQTSSATKGKYYKLKNDIDLNNILFTPLTYFSGTLDGDNHTIKGININMPSGKNAGLIMDGSDCTIKNLTLSGSVSSSGYSGGFVGYADGCIIKNCVNMCTVSGNTAGGIIGYAYSRTYSSRSNSLSYNSNFGMVKSIQNAGGIIGTTEINDTRSYYTKISNCINNGPIISNAYAGGIIGNSQRVAISYCVNSCSVSASCSGGIIGNDKFLSIWNVNYRENDYYYSSISYAYNCGNVYGKTISGGVIGATNATSGEVSVNCVYNVGRVDAGGNYAAFALSQSELNVKDCYYMSGENRGTFSGKGIGNDEATMRIAAGYSGFDFANVWTWDSTNKYPYPILKSLGAQYPYCAHQATESKVEKLVNATAEQDGSYELATYCLLCEKELSRESKVISGYSIEVKTLPTKTSYLEGKETLDLSGGVIKITCGDGGKVEIPMTDEMVSGFDNSQPGTNTLTVTYANASVTFDVTITAKTLTGIELTTKPLKLIYAVSKDALSTAGGKLTLTYNNDSTEVIDLTNAMVSGFKNTTKGNLTLTVTYGGKKTTYVVSVVDKILGDANGDGFVNAKDNAVLSAAFGGSADDPTSNYDIAADLNEDGFVNAKDRAILINNFGNRSNAT